MIGCDLILIKRLRGDGSRKMATLINATSTNSDEHDAFFNDWPDWTFT